MKVKKEQKDKRRVERKCEGLKIYSPGGELLFIAKEGFCVDYQELMRQKKRKTQYRHVKRSF